MSSLRSPLWKSLGPCLCVVAVACGEPSEEPDPLAGLTVVSEDRGDLPLPALPAQWQDRFVEGDLLFDKPFLDGEGLGPVFIRQACASCHANDGRGPGAVRKMVIVGDDGLPVADQADALPFGHTVRPQLAGDAALGITVPERDDVLVTTRFPPAVFGRGYLEAIDDREIERVAKAQAEPDSIVSGRVNYVVYKSEANDDTRFHSHEPGEVLVGRFGLKARVATLDDFTADALQGDMGITSPMRPEELPNPSAEDDELPGLDVEIELINQIADYMRLLRIPERGEAAHDAHGAALFETTGCSDCHVPALHTQADNPIEQLADIDAPIYSDLLLHDMGPSFSDGLEDFEASGSEWRTSPLMGLRHMKDYLHDGRAPTVEAAITLHGAEGSEAQPSVARFSELSAADRAALVDFVSAL